MYTLFSAWSFWKIESFAKTTLATPIRKIHLNGFFSLNPAMSRHHRLTMFLGE